MKTWKILSDKNCKKFVKIIITKRLRITHLNFNNKMILSKNK